MLPFRFFCFFGFSRFLDTETWVLSFCFFLFFLVFRGFWILGHGFCHFVFFVFFGFSKFLIPLSRENRVICMARDGCTSDTGMYSSADGCIYGLCWPENSEKTALSQCPVLKTKRSFDACPREGPGHRAELTKTSRT